MIADQTLMCECCGETFNGIEADQEFWERFEMTVCPICSYDQNGSADAHHQQ